MEHTKMDLETANRSLDAAKKTQGELDALKKKYDQETRRANGLLADLSGAKAEIQMLKSSAGEKGASAASALGNLAALQTRSRCRSGLMTMKETR